MANAKDSVWFDVFKLIKTKPKVWLYILIADIAYFLLFYGINYLIDSILPTGSMDIYFNNLLLVFLIILLYSVLGLFIYSFFKYIILHLIDSFSNKKKINFKKLKNFYLLNLFTFAISFIAFIVLSIFYVSNIKEQYAIIFVLVTFTIFSILAYLYLNINHSMFILGYKVKEIIKKSYKILFKKIVSYLAPVLFLVIIYLIYLLIVYLIVSLFNINIVQPQPTSSFNIISFIVFYFIIAFNRVYFYLITKNAAKNVLP